MKMRVHLLSDLHREICDFEPRQIPDCDVVVLAGDVDRASKSVAWARDTYPHVPVILLSGNHEHYRCGTVRANIDFMREEARGTNVHFLENDSVVIDKVRFVGCTLWTDFAIEPRLSVQRAMDLAADSLNDFMLCRWIDSKGRERTLYARDTLVMHKESRRWLEAELAKKPADGWTKTVVVTHHLPSPQSIHPRYAGNPLNVCFASDLEYLMPMADVFCHGHTHAAVRTKVGDCHLLCNAHGYDRDRSECLDAPFDPTFVFTITDSGVEVPELRTATTKPRMTRAQLLDAVPVRQTGTTKYIQLSDIPEPWRSEFKRANAGGTCPIIEEAPQPMGCAYPWDWTDYVSSGRHGVRAGGLVDDDET